MIEKLRQKLKQFIGSSTDESRKGLSTEEIKSIRKQVGTEE